MVLLALQHPTKPSSTLLDAWLLLLQRDVRIALSNPAEVCHTVFFFLLIAALFPLAISSEHQLLSRIAVGVIWVAALLATTLSLDNLFYADLEDGTLEHLALSPHPLSVLLTAKMLAHWLITGLPLTLLSPLLALMLFVPASGVETLFFSLLLGTPLLSLMGAIGAALTAGLRKGGVLLALLILPLYIPVLILGTGAIQARIHSLPSAPYLLWLSVLLILALSLVPWVAAAGVRMSLAGR